MTCSTYINIAGSSHVVYALEGQGKDITVIGAPSLKGLDYFVGKKTPAVLIFPNDIENILMMVKVVSVTLGDDGRGRLELKVLP